MSQPRRGSASSVSSSSVGFTVSNLATRLGAELVGPTGLTVRGLNALDQALPEDMTFIGSEKHAAMWVESKAAAAVVTRGIDVPGHDPATRALLRVPNADLALAELLALFAPAEDAAPPGIAPDAAAHPTAMVHPTASIQSRATVGPRTVVGARTVLEPNVHVGADVRIGDDCVLRAGVVVRDRCVVGNRVSIHPNAVIGADGFGYRPDGRGGLVKMPHIGIVEIHDDVEIGACSTVDRGKFGKTVIGAHTKLDNLVHIGHNCRVGRSCVMAALSTLGGTAVLGDFCQIGGQSAVADHRTLGKGVRLAGHSAVMNDVSDGQTLGGAPAMNLREFWRVQAALHKLPRLLKTLSRLRTDLPVPSEDEENDPGRDERSGSGC